jgi:hypothetical protein
MTKYSRSLSSAEVSQQTEEKLYDLGLLSRPRDRSQVKVPTTGATLQRKTLLCLFHHYDSSTLVPETVSFLSKVLTDTHSFGSHRRFGCWTSRRDIFSPYESSQNTQIARAPARQRHIHQFANHAVDTKTKARQISDRCRSESAQLALGAYSRRWTSYGQHVRH